MKKLLSAVLALIFSVSALTLFVSADDFPDLSHSDCVYLYNLSDDVVIYEKNSDKRISPGPAVKLMTAAVAIDCLGNDLSRIITVNKNNIQKIYGNNINLQDGEELTVLQLLHALIIGNANDVALVLAYESAGNVGEFVMKMNQKAAEIGADDTFFSNPTGLEEGDMVTTAEDVAKIAIYLSKYDIFKEITNKPYYVIEQSNKSKQRKIFNKNWFINTETEYKYYSPYVTGMTAGSTTQAGQCVVASSTYKDTNYICVVMGAEKDDEFIYSFRDCGLLLTWAYKNYGYKTVLSSSQVMCTLPVKLSAETSTLAIMPEDSIKLYLPNDTVIEDDIKINWTLTVDELVAPVEKGTVVGSVTVLYNGKVSGKTDLVAKTDVTQSEYLYFLYRLETFFSSPAFIWIITILLLAAAAAAVYFISKKRRQYAKQRRERADRSRKRML